MKTYTPRPRDIQPRWLVIDARQAILGRMASTIAHLLLGKHKPLYDVNLVTGDKVIVTNVDLLTVTGKKREQKIYYRHTGYPGGIKAPTFDELQAKRPTEILRLAVKGMLPKGPRGYAMLKNLYIYTGENHPHQAQEPIPFALEDSTYA
ncbi:MAG: 50S ribosomal protein L13 [Gammaproteobacteria bacterium]|nr:50S ribosomal protein L13 [Gammaproteobacteria bacterium]